MRKLWILLAGAVAGASVVIGAAFAHGGPGAMHPGTGRVLDVKAPRQAQLWILHVASGCHSWTDGKQVGETARLTLGRGGRLVIRNQDIDGHKLIQIKGPRIQLGKPMRMNGRTSLVFRKPGVYRFRTMSFEMAGMAGVKTMGQDHTLRLVVRAK